MSDHGDIQIRSFRVVFELDRRVHRVDRWRLPLPYGLPLRSIGYALAALVVVLALGRIPGVGTLVGALPVPIRFALLPAAVAYGLTSVRVDGRPAHDACIALLAWRLRPRVITRWQRGNAIGSSVRFEDITIAPDATGSVLRPGTVKGEAVALVRYPAVVAERRRTLVLSQAEGEPLDDGFEVEFDAGHRLVIR